MKRSTAIKLGFTAVALGLSIYGGGALTPLLVTLLGSEKIKELDLPKDLSAHVLGGLFEEWANSTDKDSRAHHNVVYGINLAAALCLEAAVTQTEKPEWKQYLSAFATDLRRGRLSLRVEQPGAPVTTGNLPDTLDGQQSLSRDEWSDFLRTYAPEVKSSGLTLLKLTDHQRDEILEFASGIFTTLFSEKLRAAYRALGAGNDSAWADLLLHLLSNMRLGIKETGEKVQQLNEHLDGMQKTIEKLVKKFHDGLEDVFKLPADESLSNLPFLYTKRETDLQGDAARRMVTHDLEDFFNDERKVCWWLWTGLEGAGKSRLALEACDLAQTLNWKAGFVDYDKIGGYDEPGSYKPIGPDNRWKTSTIEGDFLLVFDYVGSAPKLLRNTISELASRARREQDRKWRVRILLLERHVNPISPTRDVSLPQWCIELFGYGPKDSGPGALLQVQYPSWGSSSFHLGELDIPSARSLAGEYLAKLDDKGRYSTATRQPLSTEQKEQIIARTIELSNKTRRPLHVMIAARVLRDVEEGDFTSFDQIILEWLRSRVPLRRDSLLQAYKNPQIADQLLNLLCVATVLGKLPLDEIPEHKLLPDRNLLLNDRSFLGIFEQDWRSEFLSKLEPDLIGEWYVLFRTEAQKPHSGLTPVTLSEIVDEFEGAKPGLKEFVRHTYRSFHDIKIGREQRKSELWKVLRGTLGRYATRFGEVFDKQQAHLVRGTTGKAEKFYDDLVLKKIQEAIDLTPRRKPVVVDLMAGGSVRPIRLLEHFKSQIILVAVDRDDSRLHAIRPPEGAIFYPQKLHLSENFSMTPLLKKTGRTACDVVIAKKALHELSWPAQQSVIAGIGKSLHPGGSMVLYADSPVSMDEPAMEAWLSGESQLRQNLAMDGADDSPAARRFLFPPDLTFAPDDSSAALFINYWIKLKDWANYNVSEYSNRFFSSANQIRGEFEKAGLQMDGPPELFYMELLAKRFVEEAINRLDYLCASHTIEKKDMQGLFAQNQRYSLFWNFAETHLWQNDEATEFGRFVNAKQENSGLQELFQEEFGKEYGDLNLPDLNGTSFRMPIHVFSFHKQS